MKGMGKAMMGTGEAEGENRAEAAANAALLNPLIDEYSLRGAKGLLVNITAGSDLTAFEVDSAVNKIRAEVDSEAELIFGTIEDPNLEGKIRVSIVATALDGQVPDRRSVVSMVHHIHNRGSGYNHVTDVLGTTTPLDSIHGATALDMNTSIKAKELNNNHIVQKPANEFTNEIPNEVSDEISLENASYLQSIENDQQSQEKAIGNDNVDSLINQDINNENEETPNLFSDDLEINLNNQTENPNEKVNVEEKELEMFENQDSEEDFEIPAFLRRQKN